MNTMQFNLAKAEAKKDELPRLYHFFFAHFDFYSLMAYRIRLLSENTRRMPMVVYVLRISIFQRQSCIITLHFKEKNSFKLYEFACDSFLYVLYNQIRSNQGGDGGGFFISCLLKFQNECNPQEVVYKVHG